MHNNPIILLEWIIYPPSSGIGTIEYPPYLNKIIITCSLYRNKIITQVTEAVLIQWNLRTYVHEYVRVHAHVSPISYRSDIFSIAPTCLSYSVAVVECLHRPDH